MFGNKAKKTILPKEKLLLHDLKYSIARNDKSVFPGNSLNLHIEHVPVFLYYSILMNYWVVVLGFMVGYMTGLVALGPEGRLGPNMRVLFPSHFRF